MGDVECEGLFLVSVGLLTECCMGHTEVMEGLKDVDRPVDSACTVTVLHGRVSKPLELLSDCSAARLSFSS